MLLRCLLALSVLLLSCKPTLQEGAYACTRGSCPMDWFCRSDARCYSTPDKGDKDDSGTSQEAGNDNDEAGAASEDSGQANDGTGDLYTACSKGAACESGVCALGADPTATQGACSISCTSDAMCPSQEGRAAKCLFNTCLAGCNSAKDCVARAGCFDAPLGPESSEKACFSVENTSLFGTTPCTGMSAMTACPPPAGCAFNPNLDPSGLCSLRCDLSGACPANGRCLEVFPALRHCFKPCAMDSECGSTFRCRMLGGTNMVCVPPGWAGKSLPLPMPPKPT